MASYKQAFLCIALFLAISVNLSWGPNKMQLVMALRDLPIDVAEMKEKLLPLGDIVTCLRICKVDSDCSDGWICTNCVPDVLQRWKSQCDKRIITGEGYFGTILRAKRNAI